MRWLINYFRWLITGEDRNDPDPRIPNWLTTKHQKLPPPWELEPEIVWVDNPVWKPKVKRKPIPTRHTMPRRHHVSRHHNR